MTRKLVICKTARETTANVLGGFLWTVVSKRAGPDGWPALTGAMEEAFDSEAWAIVAARQRLSEGYASSDVYRQVAFSVEQS